MTRLLPDTRIPIWALIHMARLPSGADTMVADIRDGTLHRAPALRSAETKGVVVMQIEHRKARYGAACVAALISFHASVCRADPPFGNHPAYLEPLSQTQVACQINDATCHRVAAYVLETVSPWIADSALIDAVKAGNEANGKLTNREIDMADLKWIERTDKGFIDSVMTSATSKYLVDKKRDAQGKVIEIFVFDQYGLNIAQTDSTQDYSQGDEAKYWRSYMSGPGAIYIDKPRPDDGRNVSQASLTISDPATGKAIGAMTVGVDVDRLVK